MKFVIQFEVFQVGSDGSAPLSLDDTTRAISVPVVAPNAGSQPVILDETPGTSPPLVATRDRDAEIRAAAAEARRDPDVVRLTGRDNTARLRTSRNPLPVRKNMVQDYLRQKRDAPKRSKKMPDYFRGEMLECCGPSTDRYIGPICPHGPLLPFSAFRSNKTVRGCMNRCMKCEKQREKGKKRRHMEERASRVDPVESFDSRLSC